jgi:hypothetical protein
MGTSRRAIRKQRDLDRDVLLAVTAFDRPNTQSREGRA